MSTVVIVTCCTFQLKHRRTCTSTMPTGMKFMGNAFILQKKSETACAVNSEQSDLIVPVAVTA